MENTAYKEVDFASTYGPPHSGLDVDLAAGVDLDLNLDSDLDLATAAIPNTTLKNGARLEAIRCVMSATAEMTLFTPIARRHLRRDFNIASAKMYVYGLNKAYKTEIVEALSGLEFAIELLEMDVAIWSERPNPLTPCTFKMLLISPQSVRMMRVMSKLDKCMLGVYAAYLDGTIDKARKSEVLRPFHLAYLNFKRVAMKLEFNKPTAELVESMESEVRFT